MAGAKSCAPDYILSARFGMEIAMPKKAQHVVPSGEKWSVRAAGAKRASGTFETQREAIETAREKARREGTELYIHGRDGRIRERSSFEPDRDSPKR
jgi:hypothetical protein